MDEQPGSAPRDPGRSPAPGHDAAPAGPGASASGAGGVPVSAEAPTQPAAPLPIDPPRRVGRYRLVRLIARGGMGDVYEAVQDQPRRTVAVKLLRAGSLSASAVRRFERESQLLATLRHPGMAQVYEAGTHETPDGPVSYYAMELVEGARPITAYAAAEGCSREDRIELMVRVCNAVQHGHEHGVIHRDLKPANILVGRDGRPRVIDFGVARWAGAGTDGDSMHTSVGELVGTLQYMSPEQCEGDPALVSPCTDVYALGVVLYELLLGRLPYDLSRANVPAAIRVIRAVAPTKPGAIDPSTRGDLETVILTALQKDPAQRYATAAALRDDLERLLRAEPIRARRPGPWRRARSLARSLAAREPLLALAAAAAIGAGTALALAVPVSLATAPLDRALHQAAAAIRPATLDSVRLLAVTDDTDVEAAAAALGLEGVVEPDRRTWRRLYGRVLELLAQAGARAVAFDIAFAGDHPFDADFVHGVEALRAAGADTIAGWHSWSAETGDPIRMSAAIESVVRRGAATARTSPLGPWRTDLALHRPGSGARASFVLTAWMAFQHPGAAASWTVDAERARIDVAFAPSAPARPAPQRRVVHASAAERIDADAPELGLLRADVMLVREIEMPPDAALARATLDLGEFVEAAPARRAEMVGGSAVVVAVTRGRADTHTAADGRVFHGATVHAAALSDLLKDRAVRYPGRVEWLGVLLGFAGAGALASYGSSTARARVLWACGIAAAAVILSLLARWVAQYACNPGVPMVALAVAAALGAPIASACRVARRSRVVEHDS